MAAKAKVEEQEVRDTIIELTTNLLDRVRCLEYGVGRLNPIKPFEWFRLPIEEKLNREEILLMNSYKLRIEQDSKSGNSISYNVYKLW